MTNYTCALLPNDTFATHAVTFRQKLSICSNNQ